MAYAFGIGSSFLCLLCLFVAIFRVPNRRIGRKEAQETQGNHPASRFFIGGL